MVESIMAYSGFKWELSSDKKTYFYKDISQGYTRGKILVEPEDEGVWLTAYVWTIEGRSFSPDRFICLQMAKDWVQYKVAEAFALWQKKSAGERVVREVRNWIFSPEGDVYVVDANHSTNPKVVFCEFDQKKHCVTDEQVERMIDNALRNWAHSFPSSPRQAEKT